EIERMDTADQRDDRPAIFAQRHRSDHVRHVPPGKIPALRVPAEHLLLENIDVIERLLFHIPHGSFTDRASRQIGHADPHCASPSGHNTNRCYNGGKPAWPWPSGSRTVTMLV